MRRLTLFAALACFSLTACETVPPTPTSVASATVLDEKGAIAVETAYTLAARAAAIAIQFGGVRDPATVARIGELDRIAFDRVANVRSAYNAGNAATYDAAFAEAMTVIRSILALL